MTRTGIPALSKGMMVWGDAGSYTYQQGCLSITGSDPLVISTGGRTDHWILVRKGVTAHLTLTNAKIEPVGGDSGCPAILVERDATLYLTLKGVNTAKSGWGRAGIELDGATLEITRQGTGSLIAMSEYGAGIGGGVMSDECYGGTVVVRGGSVYAMGGKDSAGIGNGPHLEGMERLADSFDVTILGGSLRAQGNGRAAMDQAPDVSGYRASTVTGSHDGEVFVISPLPRHMPAPTEVVDVSHAHDASLPWTTRDDGILHAIGFNSADGSKANHACVDVTYELTSPGAIAYRWKVRGADHSGQEIFDSYWFLKGDNGTFLSGSDFLGQKEQFSTNLIDGLQPGTYTLTLGVFCFGEDGSVMLDLSPCA